RWSGPGWSTGWWSTSSPARALRPGRAWPSSCSPGRIQSCEPAVSAFAACVLALSRKRRKTDDEMASLSLLERLAGQALVRRIPPVSRGLYAPGRVARLDRTPLAGVQRRTLLQLVHHARHTRFGREHDFDHIRTVADYQRRVPLRDYE